MGLFEAERSPATRDITDDGREAKFLHQETVHGVLWASLQSLHLANRRLLGRAIRQVHQIDPELPRDASQTQARESQRRGTPDRALAAMV